MISVTTLCIRTYAREDTRNHLFTLINSFLVWWKSIPLHVEIKIYTNNWNNDTSMLLVCPHKYPFLSSSKFGKVIKQKIIKDLAQQRFFFIRSRIVQFKVLFPKTQYARLSLRLYSTFLLSFKTKITFSHSLLNMIYASRSFLNHFTLPLNSFHKNIYIAMRSAT